MLTLTVALHVEDHHRETALLHEIETTILMSNILGLARVIDLAARREKDHTDLFESESEKTIDGIQPVEMTAETGTIAEMSGEETR